MLYIKNTYGKKFFNRYVYTYGSMYVQTYVCTNILTYYALTKSLTEVCGAHLKRDSVNISRSLDLFY